MSKSSQSIFMLLMIALFVPAIVAQQETHSRCCPPEPTGPRALYTGQVCGGNPYSRARGADPQNTTRRHFRFCYEPGQSGGTVLLHRSISESRTTVQAGAEHQEGGAG